MTRARGFAPWRPQKKTLIILAQVEAILDEYAAYLPPTIRQVFYRLVGNYLYEKTEQAYDRLCEHLNRARRAGLVDFAAIRDDGVSEHRPRGFTSTGAFWGAVAATVADFRFHRQDGQPQHIDLWVEAAGMAPMLAESVVDDGVPVFSCGGFDSLTFKQDAAQRIAARDVPTIVCHVGDHDAPGVAMFAAVAEDVGEMVRELGGQPCRFHRVAVTEGQVDRLGLPTAPPKATDNRGAWRGGGDRAGRGYTAGRADLRGARGSGCLHEPADLAVARRAGSPGTSRPAGPD